MLRQIMERAYRTRHGMMLIRLRDGSVPAGDRVRLLYGELLKRLLHVHWIVGTNEGCKGEMGVRVLGANFWYYKWPDPMVAPSYAYREADKREFGETVKSRHV